MHITKHINHGLVLLSLVSFLPFAQAQDNPSVKAQSNSSSDHQQCIDNCWSQGSAGIHAQCSGYPHHSTARENCSAGIAKWEQQCNLKCPK